MKQELYFTDAAPTGAHYAPAIRCGSAIYVSGQLPVDPRTRALCTGPIEEQVQAALRNLTEILAQGGAAPQDIVRTTCYITDIAHWDAVNQAYTAYFGAYKPARTIVTVPQIHFGCLVEIDAIALCEER